MTEEQRHAIEWAIGMASQHNIHKEPLRALLAAGTSADARDAVRWRMALETGWLTSGDVKKIDAAIAKESGND